jgi:hypothetical protein
MIQTNQLRLILNPDIEEDTTIAIKRFVLLRGKSVL